MYESIYDKVNSVPFTVPTQNSKVYKDECAILYETPESPDGLYVCLKSFIAYSLDGIKLMAEITGINSLYLQIKASRVPVPVNQDTPTKLGFNVENGFSSGQGFTLDYSYKLIYKSIIETLYFSIDDPLLDPKLREVIKLVIDAPVPQDAPDSGPWLEDIKESSYSKNLPQIPNPPHINSSGWSCADCGATKNLWLNLSDGFIGCGRKIYSSGGGCQDGKEGAALRHFQDTWCLYPLVVKLGTITPTSGDVFSYAEKEDDKVTDSFLAQHLEHFGIRIQSLHKTEKSTTELEIHKNANFDWSKCYETTDEPLEPLCGIRYIGLDNTGNTCYLNSVLQMLFAIPEMKSFFVESRKLIVESLPKNVSPRDSVSIQISKVASGVLTSKIIENSIRSSRQENTSINPSMFKKVIAYGHSDFSTNTQQDACEFFIYLLTRLNLVQNNNGKDAVIPLVCGKHVSSLFALNVQTRLRCLESQTDKYDTEMECCLNLFFQTPKESNDISTGPISLASCLKHWSDESEFDGYISPATGQEGRGSIQHRLLNFPPFLVIRLKRFRYDENWMPIKLNFPVDIPDFLDIEFLRGSEIGSEKIEFVPDQRIVESLTGAGFSESDVKFACKETKNESVGACLDYLIHNNPVKNPEETVKVLLSMGFGIEDAQKVCNAFGADIGRIIEFMVSGGKVSELRESTSPAKTSPKVLDGCGKYELVGFITHIGKNANFGHYIYYEKYDTEKWALFNDSKVALSRAPPLHSGYMYLYKRSLL